MLPYLPHDGAAPARRILLHPALEPKYLRPDLGFNEFEKLDFLQGFQGVKSLYLERCHLTVKSVSDLAGIF